MLNFGLRRIEGAIEADSFFERTAVCCKVRVNGLCRIDTMFQFVAAVLDLGTTFCWKLE